MQLAASQMQHSHQLMWLCGIVEPVGYTMAGLIVSRGPRSARQPVG